LVEGYQRAYSGPGGDPETTLSAIDLAQASGLASAISTLSEALVPRIGEELHAIIAARAAVSTYAPGYDFYHVDVAQFVGELAKRSSTTAVIAAAARVRRAVDQAVIANYAGRYRQGTYGSHGIAIYFPISDAQHLHDPYAEGGYERGNTLFPVEFVEREKWTDFLHAFWALVP
jgi:hypothetical protein